MYNLRPIAWDYVQLVEYQTTAIGCQLSLQLFSCIKLNDYQTDWLTD